MTDGEVATVSIRISPTPNAGDSIVDTITAVFDTDSQTHQHVMWVLHGAYE